jgi:hypothetical protein
VTSPGHSANWSPELTRRSLLLRGGSALAAAALLPAGVLDSALAAGGPNTLAPPRRATYRALIGGLSALPESTIDDSRGDQITARFAAAYEALPPDVQGSIDFFLDGVDDDNSRGAFAAKDNRGRADHLRKRSRDSAYYRGGPELKGFMTLEAARLATSPFYDPDTKFDHLELLTS